MSPEELHTNGSVVAYGADNFNSRDPWLWSVQFTGTAQTVEPNARELDLFGPVPHFADGVVFDPVHMRIDPRFVTVHSPAGNPYRKYQNAL